jgi:hypothetical protein
MSLHTGIHSTPDRPAKKGSARFINFERPSRHVAGTTECTDARGRLDMVSTIRQLVFS